MRGFLLAGIDQFLKPYHAGMATFREQVKNLQGSLDGREDQINRLTNAQNIIAEWQKTVGEPMIQLRSDIAGAKTMDDMADLIAEAQRGKIFQ